MGLFDKFKKKETKKETAAEEIAAPGWDAITEACERAWPGQNKPEHFGTLIKWRLGGNEPLDGISIYDGGDYWHFVSYGLSELYEKECENKEYSGYGMEFTFKLKKDSSADEAAEKRCIMGILQAIARITFNNGEIFDSFEYLYTGQTQGIDAHSRSDITGFITVPDDKLGSIDTPNGRVDFVEFVGATDAELRAVKARELTVKELFEKIGSDVTDYHRASVI